MIDRGRKGEEDRQREKGEKEDRQREKGKGR